MEFLNNLKSGQYGLAKTYWLFGVAIFLPLNMLYSSGVLSYELILVTFVLTVMYSYFWIIGCWVAASNYQGPMVWAVLAKVVTVINVIAILSSTIVILGA